MVRADFSRNRVEVKYIVPVRHLPQLRAQLAGILAIDDNSGGAEIGYFNQSIYFDSRSLKYYRDKQEGLNERVKVRLRLYRKNLFSTPDGRFLEFKNRIDKIISKTRASVDQETALKLVNQCGLIDSVEPAASDQCLTWFYYLVRRDTITPVLTTLYKREAYHTVLYQDVRLTIDTNVRASSKCSLDLNLDSFRNILDPRYSIVELKYCGKVPRLIVDRIASLCLTQATFSKYGRSVETLYDVMAGHAGKAEFSSLDR